MPLLQKFLLFHYMKILLTILMSIPFTLFAQQSKQVKSTTEIGKSNTMVRINCSSQVKEPPLIIINDLVIEKVAIAKINPDHIISIEIVKDAAAIEIYGDKGKFGVIIIKAKPQMINELIESGAIKLTLSL